MNEVKAKGERVIASSGSQPGAKSDVEAQLSNLDDSYMSLQATALQIKVREQKRLEKLLKMANFLLKRCRYCPML